MASGSSRGGSSSSGARYQLLGGGGGGRSGGDGLGNFGSTGWGTAAAGDSDEEDVVTRGMSVGEMKQQQYSIIQEQDRGLEALSEVIARQKNLAQVIGSEVEYQNELIDDITDHVDRTRDRLQGETQRVRTIDRKDSTCRYWTVILTLLLIIIIIISLP